VEEARQYSVVISPVITLVGCVACAISGAIQLETGVRTGVVMMAVSPRDLGPYNRWEQPGRYALSMLWALMLLVGGIAFSIQAIGELL